MNRNYHNLTAHYNVYFNGDEAMKMGLEKIETRVEEDYTKILPVFKTSLPGTETLVMSDMNTAIDKATKLIKFHSITNQPESNRRKTNARKRKPIKPEYNKWVDDAYIMMGKAYLYQKEYLMAASTFTLTLRKFKDEDVKYQAYLWLVRTYNEAERYTEAAELIESLEGNDQFPEALEGELAIVAADLHLKQQHFEEAIQYLNIGIKKIKGNERKTRYTFILAQLYQEQGNKLKALEAYRQVVRRRPDYEMMFNARINSAGVFSGEGDVATLRKSLNKMSRKKRNEPFLDQIYYALGNILYNEGKIDDALEYYRRSAAVSVENTHQRALSCLTLAEIYFEKRAYLPAGNYYDSAMVVIDENYPNYPQIADQHASLSRLVNNLLTIETEDSLQALAALSPEMLDAKINSWIQEEEKRLAEMEASGADGMYAGAYGNSMNNRMRLNGSGGGWYFYNPSTVSYGKQEFERLWGDRKNEDNWRRSDKSISYDQEGPEALAEADSIGLLDELPEEEPRIDDPTTREFYLQDIPSNDSLLAVSNQKIRDALFNAGNIFKTDFSDFERSIEQFKSLNQRYPGNMYELPSYFHLWDLYTTIENSDSAAYYKQLILDRYPNSNYAKYLINPNFFIEEEARIDSINTLYQNAFNHYKYRDFDQALKYSRMVLNYQPDSAMVPKARFIEMIAGSRQLNKEQFTDSLNAYINTWPKAEPTPLAQQIAGLISQDKLSDYDQLVNTGYLNEVIKNMELLPQNEEEQNAFDAKWDDNTGLLHYFIIAFPNDDGIDVNRLKFDIANYNIDHYTALDFDIETENLNNETKLIIVRNFGNKENAMVYFLSIIRKPEVFKTLAGQKFLNFIVSSNNYREMLGDRSYNEYLKFFVKNYSSFTTGEFPEEELESPEELMARLNRDEEEEVVEQGEFVEIDIDTSLYQAPDPASQPFVNDYNLPHNYLLLINEPRYRTGFVMRDLVRYNLDKHRQQRLRVVPGNLPDATMLQVVQFENAYLALQYLNEIKEQEALFESLGETPYEQYIISNPNLDSLKQNNNIDEWKEFYQRNYVYRKPPAPKDESIEETPEQSQIRSEENTSVKEADQTLPEEVTAQQQQASNAESTVSELNPLAENETEKSEEISEAPLLTDPTAGKETTEDTTSVTASEAPVSSYDGEFSFDAGADQNLIYLLPSGGSNQTLLTTYLNRLNAVNFRGNGITVQVENFDDFRSLVMVTGIGTIEQANEYLRVLDADRRIGMSLRNVNYKRFLISQPNLELLKESKDIGDYQRFYQQFYNIEE
ncbi:tetratricopeptide (TPR) repeat protein [Roseimarinus sediminis]|uniref:type IX secretion system periplasmic lipoprotein PorW/SprE n=1 Tax=Roseimarinus sediminis TaxID=1610899 RepID=UPI003D227954